MEAFLLRVLFLMCCILLVPSHAMRRTCGDYYEWGLRSSGVYVIDLDDGMLPFPVYCYMRLGSGGWTVFQRRINGSVYFNRDWQDYAQGFGDLQGEFWLGNDHLHRLTKKELTYLRITMKDWKGESRESVYYGFQVGPASDNYRLNISVKIAYGDAGDSLLKHNGMLFSTKDADNDVSYKNCAEAAMGGWWFEDCLLSNLNGYYYVGGRYTNGSGIVWGSWKGLYYSLKYAEMRLGREILDP